MRRQPIRPYTASSVCSWSGCGRTAAGLTLFYLQAKVRGARFMCETCPALNALADIAWGAAEEMELLFIAGIRALRNLSEIGVSSCSATPFLGNGLRVMGIAQT